ncbi:ATP-binding protein [Streptomyces albus]|uniref:ATP-binding protein n=2 Tax=Streptomyces albus TaxID=1888 RepID=UPI0037B0AAC2
MTMERHGSDRDAHGDQHQPTGDRPAPQGARAVQLVADRYLVTVNPVDGSEVEPCPPGAQHTPPARRAPQDRTEQDTAVRATLPPGSMIERDEERERLTRLLTRGRSVRLTGPAGSGRSVLLGAVAQDVAHLAPDGVVRLSGHRRTASDLMYDLFAAVHSAPLHRPGKEELLGALAGIGAVVLVDDLECGGAALDELLRATPECAFLFAATPDTPAPAADSCVEEVFLPGLSRTACVELLERAVHRQLTEDEADWAADLWVACEGLARRFVQAGALLRLQGSDGVVPGLTGDAALAPLLAAALPEAGRGALRLALALDGELPHAGHLPALTGDPQAETCVPELLDSGLISPVGGHYRLADGVAGQLTEAGYGEGRASHALTAVQHYTWWAKQPAATTDLVTQEADALLAAVRAARRGGNASAAVLLARTAAPVLAAGMRWSAWERMLRDGQEAARAAGELAEEAYFHHELGVLALVAGHPERARTELEAALGLRGTLGEQRGMVAGRRALALVTDRLAVRGGSQAPTGGPGPFGAVAPGTTVPMAPVAGPVDDAATTAVQPAVPTPPEATTAAFPAATTAPLPSAGTPDPGAGTTSGGAKSRSGASGSAKRAGVKSRADSGSGSAGAGAAAAKGGRHGSAGGWRALAGGGWRTLTRSRRNMAAAGAGALLAAVLGTVVTLGAVSDDGPPASQRSRTSEHHSKQDNAPGDDEPGTGGEVGIPDQQQRPAAGTPSQEPDGTGSPQEDGDETPTDDPSTSTGSPGSPDESGTREPGDGSSSSQKPPPSSHKPPSSTPDDPPSSEDPPPPTDDPTTPDPPASSGGGDGGTPGGGSPGGTATDRTTSSGSAPASGSPSAQ